MPRPTRGEQLFYRLNAVFLTITAVICIAPMVHVFAVSFSANAQVSAGRVLFWPKESTLIAYRYLLENRLFWGSMRYSVLRLAIGVPLNLLFSVLAAYPLSKSTAKFRQRTFFAWVFFFTMLFGGGLIPLFILVNELGLINSIWALVLPPAVPVFYILILLNFFRNLPVELEEAAIMDGCNQYQILFRVYLPLSMPALATISVFAILAHWNSWFDGLIFMADPRKYPLMTYLQTAIVNINWDTLSEEEVQRFAVLGERTNKAAQIFLGTLPVLFTYPFFQKYFTKGLVLGSVKG